MQFSAEIRWFWPGQPPPGLVEWFHDAKIHASAPSQDTEALDRYIDNFARGELGIKSKGDSVELKILVRKSAVPIAIGPFAGEIGIWGKWTTGSFLLPAKKPIGVTKKRWLRVFEAAQVVRERTGAKGADNLKGDGSQGCQLEITQVVLEDSEVWWSFAFETFGDMENAEHNLRAVAEFVAHRGPPTLTGGRLLSYPEWLQSLKEAES